MQNSGYITKSACRGYRPRQFSAYGGHKRPHLIARLIKERTTARFIVAPAGYGKTSLALEYAETVFAWQHVFWLNAQSPCFIRDLDNGDLAVECLRRDAEAKLVIVDDLPLLDAQRAQLLSDAIDVLLEKECEVMVTCAPSCDLLGALQRDRLRMGAADLLLSDEEVDLARSEEECLRDPAPTVPAALRVPMLMWTSGPDARTAFVSRVLAEDLPSDMLLVMFSAFVLRRGSLSALASFGPVDRELVVDTFGDYPHIGYDADTDRFEMPPFDLEAIARAVKGRFDAVVRRSAFETRADLVCAWADCLVKDECDASRACDAVRLMCPIAGRVGWLLRHERDLVRQGCFFPWLNLISSLKVAPHGDRLRLLAAEALCRRMLGDEEGSLRCAKRVAFSTGAPDGAQVVSLLLTSRLGVGELRTQADKAIAARAESSAGIARQQLAWWDFLTIAWRERGCGAERLAASWEKLRDAGADEDVLALVASWLFALVEVVWAQGLAFDATCTGQVEEFVRGLLESDGEVPVSFIAISAGLSMEEAHDRGMAYHGSDLRSTTVHELHRAQVSIVSQRRRFENAQRRSRAASAGWQQPGSLTLPAGDAGFALEQKTVPVLEMRLFGRFEVAIGGVPIDPERLARKNTRVLLVLLAANRGRDLSRESIIDAMWPDSDRDVARRNFYTVWSQLRRALTLPDGTCPYLVRQQYGCRLEERYVKSDVARLDDICRELLFGKLDYQGWLEIFNEIDRDFGSELLPVRSDNALLLEMREKYRNRLVDALITGTMRLIESGNAQWAIWFARSAVSYDPTREDAYVALMRAQIAHDQRTAAMMTYLTCRRVLADELGIDPSSETTSLYDDLLGDE